MSFKKIIAALILLTTFGVASVGQAQHAHHSDPPSVHGMFLFGSNKIYLSHLPMFHSPHDYQVIVEAELSEEAKALYFQNKTNNPRETVYTLVPEVFVLPSMMESPTPFRAKIFQGHFERGGTMIANNVIVNITKVIYFKKFEPNAVHPDIVKYIYFGDENEVFGAHIIQAKPDFDHIVEVGIEPLMLELLAKHDFLEVEMPEVEKQTPVQAGGYTPTFVQTENGLIDLGVYKLGRSLYLEFGDLSF